MKQFVAMTDEMLYRGEVPPGPLIPYQCGVFCWHQLREDMLRAITSDGSLMAGAAPDSTGFSG